MKKTFLLCLLLALITGWTTASELTVYNGTGTSQFVPIYVYYFDYYTRSQFVIPAADLADMKDEQIHSLKWYTSFAEAFTTTCPIDVYLMEVDETSVSAYYDKADAQVVYQGTIEFVLEDGKATTTIDFSTPFEYHGGNLLIGCENTEKGSWKNISFVGTTVDGASIANSNSSSLGEVSVQQRNFIPKTTFTYGAPAACPKASGIEFTNITATSATMSWDAISNVSMWNFAASLESNFPDDPDKTFSYSNIPAMLVSGNTIDFATIQTLIPGFSLQPNTTYYVKLQANCGADGLGDWSNVASFHTACSAESLPFFDGFENGIACWTKVDCESGSQVSTDQSYEGASSFRFKYKTNPPQYLISPEFEAIDKEVIVEFYYKNNSNSYPETFQVGYSTTSNDVDAFTWGEEVTANDNSTWHNYVETLPAGVKYVAIRYNSDNQYFLFIDNFSVYEVPACPKPTGLAVEYDGGTEATVSWTSDAESINLYVNGNSINVTGSSYKLTGLELATTYEVSVQANCGAAGTSDMTSAVSFTTDICLPENMKAISYELTDAYSDGWGGSAIHVIHKTTNTEVAKLTFSSGASAQGTLNLCCGEEYSFVWSAGSYPYECGYTIKDINDEVILSHEGCSTSGACSAPVEGVLLDYTMNCVATVCFAPKNLAVKALEATEATIGWTGSSDSYNVRYRTAEVTTIVATIFEDDFENGLDQWKTVSNGADVVDGIKWQVFDPSAFTNGATAHSGTYVAMARSWSSDVAYNASNWLISPQIDLQGTLRFWVADDGRYPENYEVLLSTTGNDIADFTIELQAMGESPSSIDWQEVVIDLSAYAGQQGYIAIHQEGYDADYMLIDDFGVYLVNVTPAGEWINLQSTGAEITLSGLTQKTKYEIQVQGVCGEELSDWSALQSFTTENSCKKPTNLEAQQITSDGAYIDWESDADAWEWCFAGGEDNPTLIAVGGDSHIEITELTPGTTYIFKVRAVCDEDGRSDWASLTFTTECAALALPFAEYFDNMSTCWTRVDCEAKTTVYNQAGVTYEDGKSFGFSYTVNPPQYLISPEFEASQYEVKVEFLYRNFANMYPETFQVGYSITTNETDDFEWDDEITAQDSLTWQTYSHVFPAGVKYIAIKCTSDDQYYLFIDNILVEAQEPQVACAAPEHLEESPVQPTTPTSATLIWESDADAWEWYLNNDITGIETVYQPLLELTGLIPDSECQVHVRSVCGDLISEWAEIIVHTPGESTGVDDVKAGMGVTKFIEDGHLYILHDGVRYNATGKKVVKD